MREGRTQENTLTDHTTLRDARTQLYPVRRRAVTEKNAMNGNAVHSRQNLDRHCPWRVCDSVLDSSTHAL